MKKKIVAAILSLAMVFSLAACGGSSSADNTASSGSSEGAETKEETAEKGTEQASGNKEAPFIGLSYDGIGANYYFRESYIAAIEYLDGLKAEGRIRDYVFLDANNDATKQQQDIRDLISMGVDAILYQPFTAEAVSGVLKEAQQAGIITTAWGRDAASEKDLFTIVPDDYTDGYETAKYVMQNIPEGGNYYLIKGMTGDPTGDYRWQGALDAIAEYNPTAVCIGEGFGEYTYAVGKQLMEDLIVANPNVDGIIAFGGSSGLAAVDVLNEHGMDLVPIGTDGNNGFLKAEKAAMEAGQDVKFCCAVVDPNLIISATDMLLEYMENGNLPENPYMFADMPFIHADNIDEYLREDLNDNYFPGSLASTETLLEVFKIGE